MRSRRGPRATVWIAAQLVCLLAWLSGGPFSPGLAAAEDATVRAARPGRKVRVSDVAVGRALAERGHHVVADYAGFSVLDVDDETAAALAGRDGVEVRDDYDLIHLNAGTIKTISPVGPRPRASVGSFSGKRLHLVQFAAPVQPAWLESLRTTGVQIVTYIPSNAYLVYGEAPGIRRLQSSAQADPAVQWEGAYVPDFKIHPRARAIDDKGRPLKIGTDYFAIQMVDDPVPNASTLALIHSVKLAPIAVENRSSGYLNVIVPLPASRLTDIARQPEVISIQPYRIPRMLDERQSQIAAGNIAGHAPSGPGYLSWLASKGFTQQQFTASGFSVDLTDDGIDDGTTLPHHFGLYEAGDVSRRSRVSYVRTEGIPPSTNETRGCFGHGTLNAHIIAGYSSLDGFPHADGAGFRYGLGVAPFARVGSSVVFTPEYTFPDFEDLQSRAYRDGARISSNSWGSDIPLYNSDSQRYDALVRDAQPPGSAAAAAGNQGMVIVFAAGNAGPNSQTIGSPGTAKNVLTVGASENVRSFSIANGGNNGSGIDGCGVADSGADALDDVVEFSSRGPTDDGRFRPDIVAPGTHIIGGVFQASTSPGPNGTADACFDASSVCALPGSGTPGDPDNFFPRGQQFYTTSSGTSHSTPAVAGGAALVRQWFINQGMPAASPAMTRAFLMNSARYLGGAGARDTLPSQSQGMGLIDLGRAFDGTPRILRDQADLFTASGQNRTFAGTISDASRPFRVTLAWTDAPGSTAGHAYNNDLDLTVVAGGSVYKGNVFSGPVSVAGGFADRRNNVESVFLPAGLSGPFAVIVTAANINSDGVPNNAFALDQDFALVVYNATAGAVPVLAVQDAAVTGGPSTIEPNACTDLDLAIRNWGTAAATGVFATLATTTPGVEIAQAGSAYPDLAPGAAATNAVPFAISTGTDLVCGAPIALTATITTNQGVQQFTVGVASGTSTATNVASPDVPRPIADLGTIESAVSVSGITAPIESVTVSLRARHTYDADLDMFLIGPDGTTVLLTSANGGSGQDYGTSCSAPTTFDDASPTSILEGAAPFAGTFRPQQPLSAFSGRSGAAVNGVWTLRISDTAGFDSGTLDCWTLSIDSAVCSSGTGACHSATFADVPSGHPLEGWVEALAASGITAGCGTSPARFCPDDAVTRGQMAVFLLKGIAYPGPAAPPTPTVTTFADVPLSDPFVAWIEQLSAEGITAGCATDPPRYCPGQPVTRAQMAVFLLRAKHGPGYVPPPLTEATFGDVPSSHPLAPWIYELAAEGITAGCSASPARYCPDSPVRRAEMAVFLVRTFGLPMR